MTAAGGAGGFAVSVPPGPGGAGGSFRVDPERAQGCIDGLRAAVLDLTDLRHRSKYLEFPEPMYDGVSRNLAKQGRIMAQRADAYMAAWSEQIKQTADALEQQLAAYRAAEEQNQAQLT